MQQLLAYFSLLWSGKTTLKKIKRCISCTEEPLQINFALVSLFKYYAGVSYECF